MKNTILLLFLFISLSVTAQDTITVVSSHLTIAKNSTDSLFWGFAKGDEVIITIKSNKKLSEISIGELGEQKIFRKEYPVKTIVLKFNVNSTGIYQIDLTNSNLFKRKVEYNIKRIVTDKQCRNFNSTVYWGVHNDTIWEKLTSIEIESTDSIYSEIMSIDNQIWINSRGNKSCVKNTGACSKEIRRIPYNKYVDELLVYVIADQKTAEEFNKLAKTITAVSAKTALAYASSGSNLIIGLFTNNTIEAIVDNLPALNSKNKIDIHIATEKKAQEWKESKAIECNAINAYSFPNTVVLKQKLNISRLPQEDLWLCIKNNNTLKGVPVFVSVISLEKRNVYVEKVVDVPRVVQVDGPYLKN